MTLRQVVKLIDHWDSEATIYAAKPWRPTSDAVVATEEDDAAHQSTRDGLEYVLEVTLARDVLEVWSEWRGGRSPSVDERCEAVIHYATFDDYLAL